MLGWGGTVDIYTISLILHIREHKMPRSWDLPTSLTTWDLNLDFFFLILPCHLQPHSQVLMDCEYRAQVQCLHPLLLPSLGCEYLGNFLPAWDHTEHPCSTATEHLIQLLRSQKEKWMPLATSPRSWLPAAISPGPASVYCYFNLLLVLICTTYTSLAISEQDKYLISMYFYSQITNLFFWWIIKKMSCHFQSRQN